MYEYYLLQFLTDPPAIWWLSLLKLLFLAVTFFFIGFLVYFLAVTKWFMFLFWYDFIEFFTLKIYGGASAARKWKKLSRLAKKASDDHYKEIIISSHKILEKLFERLVPVYWAESFSTRLAYIGEGTFTNTEDIWWAHEFYKQVVKNEIVVISREDMEKTMEIYGQALRDLDLF